MVDVFIYFYFIGAGGAAGVGTIAFLGWKIVQRSKRKSSPKRKAVV
ncbi:hypothetical protein [Anaerobacillus arseniciselenatis]|nr:hypothetical protein [Anaerobacillus arseniciselenatis]